MKWLLLVAGVAANASASVLVKLAMQPPRRFPSLADPRAAFAARLSEQEFARVFGDFVGTRRKAVEELLDLLKVAVKGHTDVGLGPSEFTTAWDEAIKAFQRQYGLRPTESK